MRTCVVITSDFVVKRLKCNPKFSISKLLKIASERRMLLVKVIEDGVVIWHARTI